RAVFRSGNKYSLPVDSGSFGSRAVKTDSWVRSGWSGDRFRNSADPRAVCGLEASECQCLGFLQRLPGRNPNSRAPERERTPESPRFPEDMSDIPLHPAEAPKQMFSWKTVQPISTVRSTDCGSSPPPSLDVHRFLSQIGEGFDRKIVYTPLMARILITG